MAQGGKYDIIEWICVNILHSASKDGALGFTMVGLAQMVRASDCGPEGRRFDPAIPPHLQVAGIVQWLVCEFSKLEMRVRFSLPAPKRSSKNKPRKRGLFLC